MKYQAILVGILLIFMSACQSTTTLSDQYTDFDISKYKSYDFLTIEGPAEKNPDYEENIKFLQEEISKQMRARGLSQNSTAPDLQINLGIVVQDKVQTRTTNLATDPFMYSGQRNYTWESREVPVNTYKEGTLTMHFVAPGSSEAVWAGTSSRVLPKKNDKKQKAAVDVVAELFEQIDN